MKKSALILAFTLLTLLTPFTINSQWIQQSVPVSKPITGIKFIDTLRGWACTSLGSGGANYAYVLHTTSGGTNWFIQDSTVNATFGAICVIDGNIIYAGGYDFTSNSANLNKTTNSGLNWSVISTPTNMAIGDMVFLNKDSGWACSDNIGADVRTTTNGGLNWTVRTNGITQQTQRIFFLNYNTGFCGANFRLYKTTDAGISWVLNGNFSGQVGSIYFLNSITGWVGFSNINNISYTTNSGVNWVSQALPSSVYDIYFINNNTGWAGAPFDIYKTINGGINWGLQRDSSNSRRISIIDSSHGWSGDFGISYTTNGGGNIVGIKQISAEIPQNYKLYQNYPNPFNPSTNIKYQIVKTKYILLKIYDIMGREINTLVNQKQDAGTYQINFDAASLSSGTYFYKLIIDDYSETKKMILIK